jgi:hypothetical protein
MERINNQNKQKKALAVKVLSWITRAKRPLTLLELRHALGVEVGMFELDQINLSDTEDIIAVCAGLVTTEEENGIIRLVHYTA